MCGICGFFPVEGDRMTTEIALKKMTNSLKRRGPDEEGYFFHRNCGIGVRRLSIVDMAGGHQPVSNEDNTIWTAYNGEIYNFYKLYEELKLSGHIFKTRCDTEIIAHGYEEWGFEKLLEHLNGIFSFCVWDTKSEAIFLARDRLGVKPLYYCYSPKHGFVFASEIKTLLLNDWLDLRINLSALDSYLHFQFVPLEETLVENIMRLKAGNFLSLNLRKKIFTKKQYWSFPAKKNPNSHHNLAECAEELRHLLKNTIRDQMLSDLPVGAFLSGGIDSSALVLFMKAASDYPIQTFSIGFPDDPIHDETMFANKVAKLAKTNHSSITFCPTDILEIFDDFLLALDEPVADPASLPTFILAREASKAVKVVLTGEGADEVFAGYPYYRQFCSPYSAQSDSSNKSLKRHVASLSRSLILKKISSKNFISNSSKFSGFPYAMGAGEIWNLLLPRARKNSFSQFDDFLFSIEKNILKKKDFDLTQLQQALYMDSKLWLPEDLLMKLDKMTMYHSLEGRVPFLNHKLVEFVFQLPDWMKIDSASGFGKKILREALVSFLPDDVIQREKHGFNLPLHKWFRMELKDLVYETFESSNELLFFFNKKAIKRLLNLHFKLKLNVERPLWVLICLINWFEAMKKFKSINNL
jgi:asparagine synthase (glutamine-hydrolysing)